MFYFIVIYLLYGFYHLIYNIELDSLYTLLLLFFTFKIIFDFRKCTLSYLECKIRGVKKEKGYLNQFFDKLFDIRNENEKTVKLLLIMSLIVLYYACFVNNKILLFSLKDIKDRGLSFINYKWNINNLKK